MSERAGWLTQQKGSVPGWALKPMSAAGSGHAAQRLQLLRYSSGWPWPRFSPGAFDGPWRTSFSPVASFFGNEKSLRLTVVDAKHRSIQDIC